MLFRGAFAALALLADVDALRRRAKQVTLHSGDSAETLTFNTETGGVENVDCGGGMMVSHVDLPWRTTDSKVANATSESDCEACAGNLESRDILQPGWRCVRKREILFSKWFIERDAEAIVRDGLPPTHSFNLTEADEKGLPLPLPVGTSPLPKALRGIFWLTDQKQSSALASFAGRVTTSTEPKDCKWCSKGKLTLNGFRLMPVGDCHWAFATLGEGNREIFGQVISGYSLGRDLKVIYDFVFDNQEDPSFAKIRPIVNAAGSTLGDLLASQGWIADFNMMLQTPEEAANLGFPGSKTWRRRTSALFGSQDLFPYDLTQVVDGDGNRIQPAWDAFVRYQQSEVAGTSPGIIHYHGGC